jgi:hypothetical protein
MSANSLKTELVYLLRNSDVMTTTERNVTTQTDEDTLDGDTTYTIARTNVKNIRSITIDTTVLRYGEDYTVNADKVSGTTIVCEITFNAAQSGEMTLVYDYGSDKIFNDMPRKDLTMSSYPRISIEEISKQTDALSVGGKDFISNRLYTITVFSENQEYIEEKIETIENLIMTNAKTLYYSYFIRPTGRGPIIKTDNRNQIIIQKNVDLTSYYEVKNV